MSSDLAYMGDVGSPIILLESAHFLVTKEDRIGLDTYATRVFLKKGNCGFPSVIKIQDDKNLFKTRRVSSFLSMNVPAGKGVR